MTLWLLVIVVAAMLTLSVVYLRRMSDASTGAVKKEPTSMSPPRAGQLENPAQLTWRRAKRVLILMIGTTLLLIGAALLLLPGPGVPLIVAAVAVLATEFVWARVWYHRIRTRLAALADEARGIADRPTSDAVAAPPAPPE